MKGTSRLTKRLSVSVASLGLIMSALPSLTVLAADTTPVRNSGGYIGRNFDETFDKMFDDFNRNTLADGSANGLWWAVTDGAVNFTDRTSYLEAHYSATQLNTADGAIYKVASPSNSQGAYDFLVLKMRGSDGASLSDLSISFRYDDNHSLLNVGLDQLVDPDLDPLPELTSDYQLYIIDLASSLDGLEFGGASPVAAANSMVGFHLHAKNTAEAGTLGLGEVYWTDNAATLGYNASAGTDYLLDNFQREDVGEAEDGIWWRGAGPEAEIIGKWLVMDADVNAAMYKSAGYDAGDPTGHYDNFVIRAKGSVGGEDIVVTPYYNTGTGDIWGTPKALSTLVSTDGEALPELTTDFQTFVVSLSENGWDSGVQGFQFDLAAGEGEVHLDEVFFTNMEVDLSDVDTEFPLLDHEDIVVFDDFNRASVGATAEYDANNPVALANGLLYIIAYAGMDRMSMDNGSLVFDTTTNSDYMQYTVGGQHFNDGSYEYVVFKVKGTDGASLENLRMSTINDTGTRSPIVWGNGGLKSGNGLPIADFDDASYPYVTEDGYMYVMIDIASSGLSTPTHGFDLFYSGGGKLFIDSIFFANKLPLEDLDNQLVFDNFDRDVVADGSHWWTDAGQATIAEGALKLSAPANEHAYYRTASPVNNYDNPLPYLAITMKGAEGTTLDSLRLQTIGDSVIEVFANQGVLVDPYGQPIPALSTEYQTYIIDLAASGLATKAQGIGVIFGDWASGELIIDNVAFVGMKDLINDESHKMFDDFERAAVTVSDAHWWIDAGGASIVEGSLVLDASAEATHTWYRAASPTNNHDEPMKYLTITMKGAAGTTLNAVRIQTIVGANSVEVAANSGALVDELGRPIAELTTEYQTYVIDLEASGLLVNAEGVGIIFGDWDTGVLSVSEIGFVDKISNLAELDAMADPYTTAIEVVNPTKLVYEFDEELDLAGLTVNAVLSNGVTQTVAVGDYTVTGYNSTTAGEQTLTVTFDGFEYTFEVTVNAEVIPVVPSSVSVVILPVKTTYEIGDTLDLTGIVVRVIMSNNTTVTLTPSQYTVTGFNSTTAGIKTLTITYGSLTNTFMVTVEDAEVDSSGCFGGLGQDGNTGFGYLAGLFLASYLIKKILVK